ncbi:MAG: DNA ligase [Rhodocyclaceae bacterium]
MKTSLLGTGSRWFAVVCWMYLAMAWSAAASAQAPALLLAETYQGGVDVSLYWVSEKFDGVRAFWDGSRLLTRRGNEIHAPRWFLDGLPAEKLDGELWLGHRRFEELSGIVRRDSPDDAQWRGVRYLIFELPDGQGNFTQRTERIRDIVRQAAVPWLQAVEQFRVADHAALMARLERVAKAGGEGLILHLADAPYQTGRSPALLKLKPWLDAEAEVIGYRPGRGRYDGMLGALIVRTPGGRQFSLGTGFTAEQRRHPPPLGATVTYRYRELTAKGLPRHASFWRVREEF